MVPRDHAGDSARRTPLAVLTALFTRWRMLLAGIPRLTAAAPDRVRRASDAFRRASGHGSRLASGMVTRGGSHGVAVFTGLAATGTGCILAMLLRPPARPLQGVATLAVTLMWVSARLVVMRLVDSGHATMDRTRVTAAWLPGAMAGLFALTPGLRAAAWCVGAVLGLRSLTRSGAPGGEALRLIGWGYGVEVIGLLGVTLARDVGIALRLLGGA